MRTWRDAPHHNLLCLRQFLHEKAHSRMVITKDSSSHLRAFKMVILSSYVAITLLVKDFLLRINGLNVSL